MKNVQDIIDPLSISKFYSFFKKKFDKGYFFKGESHDFYEVVCVLSGNVGITAGKDVFTLKKGEMTFHPPGEFHAIWDEGESSPEVIIFSFFARTFPKTDGKIFSLSEASLNDIQNIYDSVKLCFADPIKHVIAGKELAAAITVKRTEIFLLSILGESGRYSVSHSSGGTSLFSVILSVMEKNITSALNVTKLAALCKISVPTLEKTVYKYLGYGAMAHYNILRLQRAHTMLISGKSAKETSLLLGYSNQNYFSARFKKYYGFPPSAVRRRNT